MELNIIFTKLEIQKFNMRALLFCILLIPSAIAFAQVEEEIIDFPSEVASFPGGTEAMLEFISKTIIYPKEALKNNEQGRVYLSFVIEKDGAISNIKVTRGVSNSLDIEAKRVLEMMPKWKPAKQSNRTVRSRYNLPIKFEL